MKISELTQRTGVPKQTIHYYIREGVLRKPRKTGKNTADYNEGYVEQIKIIKALQDNYFLPLSVIKKILKQLKKLSTSEKSAFYLLSDYFRPLDRLVTTEITGRETFRKVTGLGRQYLDMYEKWGVITPEERDGDLVYSQDDVIIGKLIVNMDQLGFGPKDGTDPEDLRRIADFVRGYVVDTQKAYYEPQIKPLSSEDFLNRGSKFTEVMSLFFYHLYRKLFRENYARLRKSIEKDTSSPREESPSKTQP
ncbi:MAG: hypothetical protein B1H11_05345 [Desulfobacteraceae bacterium 4484_190.1]|nr:MAG: hypothetical protein B1H11_05345 [Desulfobacteraceae bacterium 4484_190.1]RLB18009.1 MAG: hypothetical protein DRG82_04980 [Deltaproteobacteria bacterium]